MTKTTRFVAPLVFAICASACAARSVAPTIPTETRNELVFRYMKGESLEQLATELRIGDRHDAREIVHDAMLSLSKRYYRDR
jgi:hypothetical protein